MAVPKRRTSKTRRDKRRTHDGLSAVTAIECPQCKQEKLRHQVCPHCGYYKGREVIAVEKG